MSLSTEKAVWQRGPIKVTPGYTALPGISAWPATALTYAMATMRDQAQWKLNRDWQELGFTAASVSPVKNAADSEAPLWLGNYEVTLELPATERNLAILMCSLFQNPVYDTDRYHHAAHSKPIGDNVYDMAMELGTSDGEVVHLAGAVCKDFTLKVPVVDKAGGKATISATLVCLDARRSTAVGGTAPTADDLALIRSLYCAVEIGEAALAVTDWSLKISSGASWMAFQDYLYQFATLTLGALSVTGEIACVAGADTANAIEAAIAAAANGHITLFGRTAALTGVLECFAFGRFSDVQIQPSGNIDIARYPWEHRYEASHGLDIHVVTDDLSWPEPPA